MKNISRPNTHNKKSISIVSYNPLAVSGTGVYIRNILFSLADDTTYTYSIITPKKYDILLPNNFNPIIIDENKQTENEWIENLPNNLNAKKISFALLLFPSNAVPAKSHIPFISTIHDIMHMHIWQMKIQFSHNRVTNSMIKRAQFAAGVITVSQFSKDDLVKHTKIPENNIRVIYNTLPEVFYLPNTHTKPSLLPNRYILYVGDLRVRKNVIQLAKAVCIYNNSTENKLPFVFTGTGKAQDKIKLLFKRQNSSHLCFPLGQVETSTLPSLYKHASLFIFPSSFEGFGLPVIEAQTCGTPVICSNNSSLPEVAADSAVFCQGHKPKSIYQAIKSVLSSEELQNSLSQKGLKNAKRFTPDKFRTNLLSLFSDILSN
jgi:glycosyltransferase involved in cell wall biosynthesis